MPSITDIILDDTATLTAADWDFDPNAGSGHLVMTATGWQERSDVEAFVRAEAMRLQTQEPLEVEFA